MNDTVSKFEENYSGNNSPHAFETRTVLNKPTSAAIKKKKVGLADRDGRELVFGMSKEKLFFLFLYPGTLSAYLP